mmetsp:Transcript_35547/g.92667  ORF Transcript_35547/g.92667 Transcript_35547/m.92667 type:complete len:157 (-) Transcript_35547:1521-1991(-)
MCSAGMKGKHRGRGQERARKEKVGRMPVRRQKRGSNKKRRGNKKGERKKEKKQVALLSPYPPSLLSSHLFFTSPLHISSPRIARWVWAGCTSAAARKAGEPGSPIERALGSPAWTDAVGGRLALKVGDISAIPPAVMRGEEGDIGGEPGAACACIY